RRRMVDTPNQRVFVSVPGHPREYLADPHFGNTGGDRVEWTTNFRRSFRFRIPGVDLAWAAYQEQHNAINIALTRLAFRFLSVVAGQGQAERRDSAGVQKVPPREAVAESCGSLGIETQHDKSSSRAGTPRRTVYIIETIPLFFSGQRKTARVET